MNVLICAADVPQGLINVFSCIDYPANNQDDLRTLFSTLKLMISTPGQFPLKPTATAIVAGDFTGVARGTQKIAKDVPQELLNLLSAIDHDQVPSDRQEQTIAGLQQFLFAGQVIVKPNFQKYLQVA